MRARHTRRHDLRAVFALFPEFPQRVRPSLVLRTLSSFVLFSPFVLNAYHRVASSLISTKGPSRRPPPPRSLSLSLFLSSSLLFLFLLASTRRPNWRALNRNRNRNPECRQMPPHTRVGTRKPSSKAKRPKSKRQNQASNKRTGTLGQATGW